MVKQIGNSDKEENRRMKTKFNKQYWESLNALLHKYGVAPLTERTNLCRSSNSDVQVIIFQVKQ